MIISIVACGDSAKDWYKTPCDLSIGVNDCWKFGHSTDYLLCVNSPTKFDNERFNTIRNSEPAKFFMHNHSWKHHFPEGEILFMKPFTGRLKKGAIYKSVTSPFIALSMAFNEGAKEIILWGVDFINHKHYSPGKSGFKPEVSNYKRLIGLIEENGCRVFIGNRQTALDGYVPLYVK